MLQPLDGPSKQFKLSVGTVTVLEVLKPTESALQERKVVTIQADGKIKIYFGDGSSTPSAATVAADGLTHYKNGKESYEASETQPLFILADSGTVGVIVVERA